uniref:Complement component C8 beta chain n=1 Tax=Hucho hucho TaxID=62062 RepID=A0A4W5PYG0_9TELE
MLSVSMSKPTVSPGYCLLCAALCLLLLCDVAIASSGEEPSGIREARSVGTQVAVQPVDCVQSEWSSWTRCDVCRKKRYRYAKLVQPSQFGGEPCHVQGKEVEPCSPPSRYDCTHKETPLCEGFLCTYTGRCVPIDLRCNGDDDCGDRSDEKGCQKVNKACKQEAQEYYGIENLAKGINILNSNLEGVVIDNRYYAGSCLPHYIQDVRFRKPYNLQQYTLEQYTLEVGSFITYSKDTVKGSMVEDFVAVVRGGDSESITWLAAKKLPTPQLMRLWGEAVHYNPDFISSVTRPLYELVTSRDFSSANSLKKNLRRALAEYLEENSSCRCAPCHNNGLAVLKGTRCECVCPSGYSGLGCEITQRPGHSLHKSTNLHDKAFTCSFNISISFPCYWGGLPF